MQPRTLLVLTAVVVLLGAFIFFYEQDLPSTGERVEREKKVMVFEKDEVTALEIEHGGERIRLERQEPVADEESGEESGDDADKDANDAAPASRVWRLVEPLEARADRTAVDGLIDKLAGLEKKRTLEDIDRAAAGLDQPQAQVSIVTGDGETVLEVGGEVPASSDRLIAAGGEVYQVDGGFLTDLTRDAGDWRDRKLFHASRSEIERLNLAAGDARLLLARRGDDFWIESPFTDRADSGQVDGLLSGLVGLEVDTFLEPPQIPAELGLEPPRATLEAVLKGGDTFSLELGRAMEEDGGVSYARADDQLITVETDLADKLARPAGQWRSRAWTALQVFRIDAASFADAAGSVALSRQDADWLRGEDRIAYSTASDLLYALSDIEAEEVIERPAAEARGFSLTEPRLTITLATQDDEAADVLKLYPGGAGELHPATTEGREVVLLIGSEQVQELESKLDDLRQAEPLPAANEDSEENEENDEDAAAS